MPFIKKQVNYYDFTSTLVELIYKNIALFNEECSKSAIINSKQEEQLNNELLSAQFVFLSSYMINVYDKELSHDIQKHLHFILSIAKISNHKVINRVDFNNLKVVIDEYIEIYEVVNDQLYLEGRYFNIDKQTLIFEYLKALDTYLNARIKKLDIHSQSIEFIINNKSLLFSSLIEVLGNVKSNTKLVF